ncbi:unnamed protein product [Calypogeia fissa]
METDSRLGAKGNTEMAPLQQQVQVQNVGGGAALVLTPSMDSNLPQPVYMLGLGQVMTDEQLETLRRQISVYSTICHQLVEMHKASVSAQTSLAGMVVGRHVAYDPLVGTPNHKTTARQRWTPSQSQLQILERLFDQGNGTPHKTRLKEITAELSQHGQIAETNVYNWFQNRKARAKRKQQLASNKDGESEVDTDNDSPNEKKPKFDKDSGQEYSNSGGLPETASDGGGTYDQKPNIIEQYDQQESASSHMQVQADSTQCFGRAVPFEHGYTKSVAKDSSLLNIMVDGKLLEIPSGVIDVKGSFGETAVLLDSHGQNVRTDDAGMTLQPLHAGESYSLSRGLVDGLGRSASEGMQKVVGAFNNGVGNGSLLRPQTQS